MLYKMNVKLCLSLEIISKSLQIFGILDLTRVHLQSQLYDLPKSLIFAVLSKKLSSWGQYPPATGTTKHAVTTLYQSPDPIVTTTCDHTRTTRLGGRRSVYIKLNKICMFVYFVSIFGITNFNVKENRVLFYT